MLVNLLKDRYFINYGGPIQHSSLASLKDHVEELDKACKKKYFGSVKRTAYLIHGLIVTVCAYGIHRALLLELPEEASDDTTQTFYKTIKEHVARNKAPYILWSHNCVTAVSNVLHGLDERITAPNLVCPWTLDKHLKKYKKINPELSQNDLNLIYQTKKDELKQIPAHETGFFSSVVLHETHDTALAFIK